MKVNSPPMSPPLAPHPQPESPRSVHLGVDALLDRFAGQRVVILGDVMLDEYWWGSVERISPEAPVPVVAVERREIKLGGAANVARNLHALGGIVRVIGVIGNDRSGEEVRTQFDALGIQTSSLVIDRDRPTTVKTRIVANHQQVVRADVERTDEIDGAAVADMVSACQNALRSASGLIISDYGKGVITRTLLDQVIACARENHKFVVVDPKDTHFAAYRRVTTLTPNHHEAGFVAGRRIRDDASLRSVGFDLLAQLEAESLLITRGEHGMALFEPPNRLTTIPTVARHVYDVTGAGDTVIATVAMCLAAGGSMLQAAYTANIAAGEVIKEVGTAQTTVSAIRRALSEIPDPELNGGIG